MANRVKALACALLEDNSRALFLVVKDSQGAERLILPCVLVEEGKDPISLLVEAFKKQTGIDGEIGKTVFEEKWNAGSRKKRNTVPCLCYAFKAKNARCVPSREFSGFKWLSLTDAKKARLDRKLEWLTRV